MENQLLKNILLSSNNNRLIASEYAFKILVETLIETQTELDEMKLQNSVLKEAIENQRKPIISDNFDTIVKEDHESKITKLNEIHEKERFKLESEITQLKNELYALKITMGNIVVGFGIILSFLFICVA